MIDSTEVITDENMLPPAVDFPGDLEDLNDPGWVLIRVDEKGTGSVLSIYGEMEDDILQQEVDDLVKIIPMILEEESTPGDFPVDNSPLEDYKQHEDLLPDIMKIDKIIIPHSQWILAHIS